MEHAYHEYWAWLRDWANWGLVGYELRRDALIRELRRRAGHSDPRWAPYLHYRLEEWTVPMLLMSILSVW